MPVLAAGPFVKWAGGKQGLLEQFKPFFPRQFNGYIEPFVGSGAVFFYVARRFNPSRVILMDSNQELISTYQAIQTNASEVTARLERLKRTHSKHQYLSVRDQTVEQLTKVERAARFIYLNKTCFNGLYRVNSRGQFNVPMGRYVHPKIFDAEVLQAVSAALKGVALKAESYERCLEYAQTGDFIYFDPPYHPLSRTANFTSYTKDSFGESDQERLAEVFVKLHKRKCFVMLSNSDTPFIEKLYENQRFELVRVKARRAINSDASKRGAITELVVINYKSDQ